MEEFGSANRIRTYELMVNSDCVNRKADEERNLQRICEVFPALARSCLTIGLAISSPEREEWWTMETKFLSLRHSVELGSQFDDWQVCWLGGWDRHRLFYFVMLVKVASRSFSRNQGTARTGTNRKRGRQNTGGATIAGSVKDQTSTE